MGVPVTPRCVRALAPDPRGAGVHGCGANLDRDLRDADTRFNLQLATRALATMRAINDTGEGGRAIA